MREAKGKRGEKRPSANGGKAKEMMHAFYSILSLHYAIYTRSSTQEIWFLSLDALFISRSVALVCQTNARVFRTLFELSYDLRFYHKSTFTFYFCIPKVNVPVSPSGLTWTDGQ